MRLSALFAAYASTLVVVNGLNILISVKNSPQKNDATANGFRTMMDLELPIFVSYKAVKAKGHNVYVVAAVSNQ